MKNAAVSNIQKNRYRVADYRDRSLVRRLGAVLTRGRSRAPPSTAWLSSHRDWRRKSRQKRHQYGTAHARRRAEAASSAVVLDL